MSFTNQRGQRPVDRHFKSAMERALDGIELDAPARIGGSVFQKGVPVIEVILRAQSDALYVEGPLTEKTPDKAVGDPWIREMYDLTTNFHKETGKKVQISDLLEAFMCVALKDVEQEDRELFGKRLRARLDKQRAAA
jgi:hypothetical protein